MKAFEHLYSSLLIQVAMLGTALFASACVAPGWSSPSVVVSNQLGYLPYAPKSVVVVSQDTKPLDWVLINASAGTVVAQGRTVVAGNDAASGDHVHKIDLSSVRDEGTYVLSVASLDERVPIRISSKVLDSLVLDAAAYFYFHRLGVPIDSTYLRHEAYGRPALHPKADRIPARDGWTSHVVDARFAWADAGDYGIYPVNHAIAAWTLMNLHERYQALGDGTLSIPENKNGKPDIIDEVMFGSTFMASLLPPQGLVSHKIHNERWSAFPIKVNVENRARRWAMPPSTNATWAVVRTYAHLSRIVRNWDKQKAAALLKVAKEAYVRAEAMPDVDYMKEDMGGGPYSDEGNEDDHYAAAVELYLTTGEAQYRTAVMSSSQYGRIAQFDWQDAGASGTLSLLSRSNDLPRDDLEKMKRALISMADDLVTKIQSNGYPTPLSDDEYVWGSNGKVVNALMLIAYAYDLTKKGVYLTSLYRAMDYIFGVNAMRMSYVSGYGIYSERDLHDRWAWGAYLNGVPFPPGWLVGGPNNHLINDKATPQGTFPAKSYASANTAPSAWCSKENAINWNASLVWMAWYLQNHASELAQHAGP